MENIKNHPAPDQLDSFDKYPPYYGQDLELAYTPQRSVFTLWAPTASKTRLNIYSSGEGGNPEEQLEMEPSDDGTWRIAVERDLNGSFYTCLLYTSHCDRIIDIPVGGGIDTNFDWL